jgi:hypothetical protein
METKQAPIKYVICSDTRGVYLGEDYWSAIEHGKGRYKAPVFTRGLGVRVMKVMIEATGPLFLKEVYPDERVLGQDYASEEACSRAGIRRWNPSLYVEDDA